MKIPQNAYLLIIGAMKSGTSTLYNHIAKHPQICPCIDHKEPEFFSSYQNHGTKVKKYEDLWKFNRKNINMP